jgi:Na+/proline symporter
MVLCMAPLTTDQAVLQRLFTTKSSEDCRRSIIIQAVLVMPITFLLFAVGITLFSFYHFHPERLAGLQQPDEILPLFAARELPAGISGMVIASIFSASIAVMSAGINALTTATTIDFYQRVLRPRAPSTHYGTVGRIGTVFWGAMATFCALFAGRLGDLALSYNRVSSVISGPLLGIFLLATLTRRATATGAVLGAVSGAVVISCVSGYTNWTFFYYGPLGVMATLAVGYVASLAMKAPTDDKIRGLVVGYGDPALVANSPDAEPSAGGGVSRASHGS